MQIEYTYKLAEKYLPTPKCITEQTKFKNLTKSLTIKDMLPENFPIAFVVRNRYNATGSKQNKNKIYTEEIRYYAKNFYKQVRNTKNIAIHIADIKSYINNKVNIKSNEYYDRLKTENGKYDQRGLKFNPDISIITSNNANEMDQLIKQITDQYIICNDILWEKCGEPTYYIRPDSTRLLNIDYVKNFSKNKKFYNGHHFNALEHREALEYCRIITDRKIPPYDVYISVLMPELIADEYESEDAICAI